MTSVSSYGYQDSYNFVQSSIKIKTLLIEDNKFLILSFRRTGKETVQCQRMWNQIHAWFTLDTKFHSTNPVVQQRRQYFQLQHSIKIWRSYKRYVSMHFKLQQRCGSKWKWWKRTHSQIWLERLQGKIKRIKKSKYLCNLFL